MGKTELILVKPINRKKELDDKIVKYLAKYEYGNVNRISIEIEGYYLPEEIYEALCRLEAKDIVEKEKPDYIVPSDSGDECMFEVWSLRKFHLSDVKAFFLKIKNFFINLFDEIFM